MRNPVQPGGEKADAAVHFHSEGVTQLCPCPTRDGALTALSAQSESNHHRPALRGLNHEVVAILHPQANDDAQLAGKFF
jgi:hypothetical protein